MNMNDPISSIMTKSVLTVNVSNSLKEAEHIFLKNHIRHLPVVSNKKLIGILSLTDLRRLSFADNFGDEEDDVDTAIYNMLGIAQIMITNPVAVQSDQSIGEVTKILVEKDFHAVPVLKGDELVGIVSTTDLLKHALASAS